MKIEQLFEKIGGKKQKRSETSVTNPIIKDKLAVLDCFEAHLSKLQQRISNQAEYIGKL